MASCGSSGLCQSYRKEHGKIKSLLAYLMGSLVAHMVKGLPAVRETWVQSQGWDDPLEEDIATHPSILAWRIPRTEGPGGLQSMGSQRVRHD